MSDQKMMLLFMSEVVATTFSTDTGMRSMDFWSKSAMRRDLRLLMTKKASEWFSALQLCLLSKMYPFSQEQ